MLAGYSYVTTVYTFLILDFRYMQCKYATSYQTEMISRT